MEMGGFELRSSDVNSKALTLKTISSFLLQHEKNINESLIKTVSLRKAFFYEIRS